MWILFSLVALVLLLVVVYPRVQEQRERELARRLEQEKDPTVAMIELDTVMRQHRHEAGFFRALMKYIWPSLFG
jgi:hypothetical protein